VCGPYKCLGRLNKWLAGKRMLFTGFSHLAVRMSRRCMLISTEDERSVSMGPRTNGGKACSCQQPEAHSRADGHPESRGRGGNLREL